MGTATTVSAATSATRTNSLAEEQVPNQGIPAPTDPSDRGTGVDGAGSISPEGRQLLAETDGLFGPKTQFSKAVNVVSDLGLDPTGKTPINRALESAESSGQLTNARVMFPSGKFLLGDDLELHPEQCSIVGKQGQTAITVRSNSQSKLVLKMNGHIDGLTLDMTPRRGRVNLTPKTEDQLKINNIQVKGYVEAIQYTGRDYSKREPKAGQLHVGQIFNPEPRTENSVIRMENITAVDGSAQGLHVQPDQPVSSTANQYGSIAPIYIGPNSKGTLQLVNWKVRGFEIGTYLSKTHARVHVLGGTFVNNGDTQLRIGGKAIADGVTMVLDDRKLLKRPSGSVSSFGTTQGVKAIRIQEGPYIRPSGTVVRNCEIIGNSVGKIPGLIEVQSSAGAAHITHCRIENNLDVPAILGEAPDSGLHSAPPGPQTVTMDNLLIEGESSAAAIEIDNRPTSHISQSCIKLPGASRNSIEGAKVGSGVGFGRSCKVNRLNLKKVGSGGDISSSPRVTQQGGGDFFISPLEAAKRWLLKGFVGIIVAPLIGLVVVFLLLFTPLFILLLFMYAGKKALNE